MSVDQEKINKVENLFADEVEFYNQEIRKIFDLMQNMTTLNEAQILALSLRQKLVDKKRETSNIYNKQNSNLRKDTNKRFQYWKGNGSGNFKTDYREIKVTVDGETNLLKTLLEIFQTQITYYNDTISNLTSIQFAIKNKVEMEKGFI